ncbi:MAG: CpaF family protein [Candidatus Omnitrophica bacterium]|nr:CpaF family protein [Candidatus Omnitrophota bacterium]MDD5351866.1 CpaF family protein [Candidatus Omnitrophota bacterium]MDD5550692.1 CpaF family protein [Candidatus Omnitrophota bacterium]
MEDLKKMIQHRLVNDYDILFQENINEEKIRSYIDKIAETLPSKEKEELKNEKMRKDIAREIMDSIIGLGQLKPLIDDPEITEIMVNGHDKIYIERNGRMELASIKFNSERDLMTVVHRIVAFTKRRVDESNPYVDLSLSDGSRVNIILPPLSLTGPAITIRKFLKEIRTIEDLVSRDTLTKDMADFLIASVKAKLNIVFSGATGTGKTTTLNMLLNYIPSDERIITIEDTAELKLSQENLVRLETRQANVEGKGIVSIRDLFRNSLRMRPDRIILGEIRSDEALDMLQAISSGHGGTLAIIHAGSPQEVISRIETMIAISNAMLPVSIIRQQIVSAIDIIVHQEQLTDGSRKVTYISEVREFKDNEVLLKNIFSFEIMEENADEKKVTGKWKKSGPAPLFINKLKKFDKKFTEDFFKSS